MSCSIGEWMNLCLDFIVGRGFGLGRAECGKNNDSKRQADEPLHEW